MITITTKPKILFFAAFLLLFSLNLSAQCSNTEIISTGFSCGVDIEICKDGYVTDINVPVLMDLAGVNDPAVFVPCDIQFPETQEPGALSLGEIFLMGTEDDCNIKYVPNLNATGIDYFDYIIRLRDICTPPVYCGSGEGKIWTMNNAYYGPNGAAVVVSSKNVAFATVYDLESGKDFFINGKGLPNSNSNWTFNFYFDGDITGTPDETADVHTSCSFDIFGEDFGIFSPIAGCVATQSDKANCSEEALQRQSDNPYRAINEVVISETFDIERVTVLIEPLGSLPIEFSQIMGRAIDKDNLIQWGIESVVDEERLVLQKSNDGVTFEDLTYYTDLEAGEFDFLDVNVTNKVTFYRFTIISNNGEVSTTRSISVTNKKVETGNIDVFPNPTTDEINYNSDVKISKVSITDLGGRIVYSNNFDSNAVNISSKTMNVASGIYFTNITLENGQTITKKLSILN